MPSGHKYPEEVKAIKDARDAAPNESAKGLATRITGKGTLSCRTFYSVYSVIRRYDASKKAAKLETLKTGYGKGKKSAAVGAGV